MTNALRPFSIDDPFTKQEIQHSLNVVETGIKYRMMDLKTYSTVAVSLLISAIFLALVFELISFVDVAAGIIIGYVQTLLFHFRCKKQNLRMLSGVAKKPGVMALITLTTITLVVICGILPGAFLSSLLYLLIPRMAWLKAAQEEVDLYAALAPVPQELQGGVVKIIEASDDAAGYIIEVVQQGRALTQMEFKALFEWVTAQASEIKTEPSLQSAANRPLEAPLNSSDNVVPLTRRS